MDGDNKMDELQCKMPPRISRPALHEDIQSNKLAARRYLGVTLRIPRITAVNMVSHTLNDLSLQVLQEQLDVLVCA